MPASPPKGLAKTSPVADNDTAAGRQKKPPRGDRRVRRSHRREDRHVNVKSCLALFVTQFENVVSLARGNRPSLPDLCFI